MLGALIVLMVSLSTRNREMDEIFDGNVIFTDSRPNTSFFYQ